MWCFRLALANASRENGWFGFIAVFLLRQKDDNFVAIVACQAISRAASRKHYNDRRYLREHRQSQAIDVYFGTHQVKTIDALRKLHFAIGSHFRLQSLQLQ